MIPSIRLGDAGPGVRDVQRRLARAFDPALPVDGVFGPQTHETIRRFQQERGLAADGVVGPETWRAIVDAGYALGDRMLWRSRRMMRGDDVRELQHRLNQLGFDAGPEDGLFGPLAQAAVEEFQRNVGLEVDGVAGHRTVEALRRLHRGHMQGGAAARVREREWMRRLSARGPAGARIMVDPAHGPDDPGCTGPSGVSEATLTWQLASRLAARLGAAGARTLLARGPATTPSNRQRAQLANEQGVDLVVSIALNAHPTPTARGCSSYYYGSGTFVSEAGLRLAELTQRHMVASGWGPDCRYHPATWALLRETRMPAVVVEPAFLTSPDEAHLLDPTRQEELAAALARAVTTFLSAPAA